MSCSQIKDTYLLHASFAHSVSSAGSKNVSDRCGKAAESGHLSISLFNTTEGIGMHGRITEGTKASQELNASFLDWSFRVVLGIFLTQLL